MGRAAVSGRAAMGVFPAGKQSMPPACRPLKQTLAAPDRRGAGRYREGWPRRRASAGAAVPPGLAGEVRNSLWLRPPSANRKEQRRWRVRHAPRPDPPGTPARGPSQPRSGPSPPQRSSPGLRERQHAQRPGAAAARGRRRGDRPAPGRERHRQGGAGPGPARPQPPLRRPLRRGQLRGPSRGRPRVGAVRARERRLHRRRAAAPGPPGAGPRRDDVPRRGGRLRLAGPAEAAAGPAGAPLRARRRRPHHDRRRPRRGRHQRRSGRRGAPGAVPRRPVLPPPRDPRRAAAAAGPARGRAPAGAVLPGAASAPGRRRGSRATSTTTPWGC